MVTAIEFPDCTGTRYVRIAQNGTIKSNFWSINELSETKRPRGKRNTVEGERIGRSFGGRLGRMRGDRVRDGLHHATLLLFNFLHRGQYLRFCRRSIFVQRL